MKFQRALLLLFTLVAGAVVGALAASVCGQMPWLAWLAFSRSVGLSPAAPFVLDLSVLKFSFGFSIDISVAQVLCIALAVLAYSRLARGRR